MEELLTRAAEIKQPKRREKLINHADDARISQQLVKLDDNAPVPMALEDFKTHDPEKPALIAFLQKHDFKSILKRLGAPAPSTNNNTVPSGNDDAEGSAPPRAR